jgi:hypothetical protein
MGEVRLPRSGEHVHYVNKKGECQDASILRIAESDADRRVVDLQLAQPAEHQREQYLLRADMAYSMDHDHKSWHYIEDHEAE